MDLKLFRMWMVRILAAGFVVGCGSFPVRGQSDPAFSTQTPTAYTFGTNTFAVYLPIENSGGSDASNVQVTSATYGPATLTVPTLPSALGEIPAAGTVPLYLNFADTSLVSGHSYLLTVRGTYVFGGATLGFTLNRIIDFGVPSIFQLPPNLLNVTPNLDPTHAASRVISGANGGTLTTTGADGTVFTLTVPPNALLSDEYITMTPVLSLGNLPSGGSFGAGVEFQPEGLLFLTPATLTITPSTPPGARTLAGYGYHSSGNDFYLTPVTAGANIVVTIYHFSGAGYLSALNDELAQTLGQGVEILESECALSFLGICSGGTLQEFYDQVLQPLVSQALQNDAYVPQAIGYILFWSAVVNKNSKVFQSEVTSLLIYYTEILDNFFDRASTDCNQSPANAQTDLAKMIFSIENLNTLFGAYGAATIPGAILKIGACAVGPLSFSMGSTVDGTSTVNGTQIISSDSTVRAANVAMTFNLASLVYQGSGPLDYISYSYSIQWGLPEVADCSSGVGNDGTIQVTAAFDLNTVLQGVSGNNPNNIRMQVRLVPNVTETITVCDMTPVSTDSATATQSLYNGYLAIANGGTGFGAGSSSPSPYFVNINTSQTFNLSGSISSQDDQFSATEDTEIDLDQASQ